MLNQENAFYIKTNTFAGIKECVDLLTPNDANLCLSENPYIDIEDIAEKCGLEKPEHAPPCEVEHKHAVLRGSKILLNDQDSLEKQRFSIAHEIYHFLVGQGDNKTLAVARQGETWKKAHAGSDKAVEEEIADYFAANLLIPTERFILWEDKTDEEIAKAFAVEPKCIRKRRQEIEYELDLMAPKNLSSNTIEPEDLVPLPPNEVSRLFEGYNSCDNQGRT